MIRRHAIVMTSALLLLGSTPVTTLASHGAAPKERLSVVNSTSAMVTVMHYFNALKQQGRSSHRYAATAH